ncbi:MAG: serpin family protein [Lachnospiraceae bacterium]|nr:serpin family protein [Lachnospiraceae bacterium]
MRRKLWKGIALICAMTMLAGCSDVGNVSRIGDETRESQGAEPAKQESEARQGDEKQEEGMAAEETKQDANARTLEQVSTEKFSVDPMKLKDSWQRAAFFADWVYQEKKENTLVSPMSLNMALGLAAEGASGDTAKELYQYLGREDYAKFAKDYMDFAEGIAADKGTMAYNEEFSFHYEIANSLWIYEKKRLIEEYQKNMEENFHAEVAPVDFVGDPAGAAKQINDWCNEKTHEMIPEILKESDIKGETRAILVNSLYFESPWVEKWRLAEHDFTEFSGKKTTQEMLVGGADWYYENEKATAFGKNYYNGFRFIGILPKQEGEFCILDLDLESLVKSESADYQVSAVMPKLDYDTTEEAVENILKAQGIETPFYPHTAQFDKILENEEMHIGQILQKCKIELNENGTKAAAVTAIMLRANGIAPAKQQKEVNLDRPFAFLIYDSVNEEIVFVGKVIQAE